MIQHEIEDAINEHDCEVIISTPTKDVPGAQLEDGKGKGKGRRMSRRASGNWTPDETGGDRQKSRYSSFAVRSEGNVSGERKGREGRRASGNWTPGEVASGVNTSDDRKDGRSRRASGNWTPDEIGAGRQVSRYSSFAVRQDGKRKPKRIRQGGVAAR